MFGSKTKILELERELKHALDWIKILEKRLYLLENPQKFKDGAIADIKIYGINNILKRKCTILGMKIKDFERYYFIQLKETNEILEVSEHKLE
jgi:hypothetical protein